MSPERPNLVLIMADQLRHDWIGPAGAPWVRTPHLDALARRGATFTHAFTPTPVCVSARCSLLSGQWSSTHGWYSNHHKGSRPPDDLPAALRAAGYRTGFVGKNHSFVPSAEFDFARENPQPVLAGAAAARRDWARGGPPSRARLGEEAAPGGEGADPETATTAAALEFLASRDGRPLFLWLSYSHPHTPYHLGEPWFTRSLGREIPPPPPRNGSREPFRRRYHRENNDAILPFTARQTMLMRQVYTGMVEMLDAEVGRVFAALARAGLLEDTLVVFTSDHGEWLGDFGLYAKSPSLHDDLVRIPLLAAGPGVAAGARIDDFVSLLDLYPTFAEAAGAGAPARLPGAALQPCWGPVATGPARPYSFAEYGVPTPMEAVARLRAEGAGGRRWVNPSDARLPWEGNPVALAGRMTMARSKEWKLVLDEGGDHELYHLPSDPLETCNRFRDPACAVAQAELTHALRNRGATLEVTAIRR